jgi:hypothetical protein
VIEYVFVWCFQKRETDMKPIKTNAILLALLLLTVTGCQLIEKRPYRPDLSGIDHVVEEEIEKDNVPGAVVLVGQGDTILYFKAFGYEVNEPFQEQHIRPGFTDKTYRDGYIYFDSVRPRKVRIERLCR